jgi:hypothetical protein
MSRPQIRYAAARKGLSRPVGTLPVAAAPKTSTRSFDNSKPMVFDQFHTVADNLAFCALAAVAAQ